MFNSCFTYTLGHVKKSGIVDALNLRHLKFDASTNLGRPRMPDPLSKMCYYRVVQKK